MKKLIRVEVTGTLVNEDGSTETVQLFEATALQANEMLHMTMERHLKPIYTTAGFKPSHYETTGTSVAIKLRHPSRPA